MSAKNPFEITTLDLGISVGRQVGDTCQPNLLKGETGTAEVLEDPAVVAAITYRREYDPRFVGSIDESELSRGILLGIESQLNGARQ